ncbi:MAG: hypothetical protein F4Y35_02555 [Chloroflexi bacterium]|nr:hypothetical protein [Chloroflexota bacterium]
MDAHEVPTHLQAEDRVLLWFTFPQIVALTAVAALAYGAYHAAPVGGEFVRIGLGLVVAAVGIALVAGKVNGRRLPAVAADLLRFVFGARRFQGPPAQLIRPEAPKPPGERGRAEPPLVDGAGLTRQAASGSGRVKRGANKLANLKPSKRTRTRGERMPLRPREWFRKRDRKRPPKREYDEARQAVAQEQQARRAARWPALLGAAAAVAVAASVGVCTPPLAVADDGERESWTSDEIEFDPPPLIEGRRLFVERLTVTRGAATVVLRAAANLEVEASAFGGADGRAPTYKRVDTLGRGGRTSYLLPLDGPAPSFTFSWRDEFGQAGAISLSGSQLPYPLPAAQGELCDLRLISLSWTPSGLSGTVDSDCVGRLDEPVELQTVSGHAHLSQTALLPAEVTAVSGTLTIAASGRETGARFVADGETRFELALRSVREIVPLEIAAALTADLRIALPPLVRLTHHPYRVERRTETVTLTRPGTGQTVSETVTLTDAEGNSSSHTISAYLSIPPATVQRQVTLEIEHREHVRSVLVQRPDLAKTRNEQLTISSAIAADDSFRTLVVPAREPDRSPSVQTRLTDAELNELFAVLGWGAY